MLLLVIHELWIALTAQQEKKKKKKKKKNNHLG